MTGKLPIAVVVGILLAASSGVAQIGTANFDVDMSGNPILADQRLLFEYGAAGVTLTKVGGQVGECDRVYANSNGPEGFGSSPNVVSLCPSIHNSWISENLVGLIRASFLTPVVRVCVDVYPSEPSYRAVMRAYDAGDRLISETWSSPGVVGAQCVGGERIRRVEFSGKDWDLVSFDNLWVDYGAVGAPTVRFIPGAANLPGAGGTNWRTDLALVNPIGQPMECRIELLVRDESDPEPDYREVSVGGYDMVRFDNVLGTLFDFEGAATLKVICEGGRLVASARTYNDDPDGTFGQFIPGLSLADGISPGRTGIIPLVRESEDPSSGFRTNLGLVNPTGRQVRIRLTGGSSVETLFLDPYQSIQINRLLSSRWGEYSDDTRLRMFCSYGGCVFFAYASVVDNQSGDGIFIPAIVD